jgi:glycosyltransferase involved in cell wall biosynthesis
MATPFVTVLIDTYNHESFIADAIYSVLQQDFPPSDMEILVVDDGSTDRTPEIVRKFAPRVQLLRKANGGQASAFNAGIPESRGEVVAFLDGDDWWAAGKLTLVSDVFAKEAAVGLLGHGVTQVYPDGRRRTESQREPSRFRIHSIAQAKTFRLCRGFFGTSRMACRRKVLRQIGPVPETLTFEADEYLFTLAAFLTDAVILPDSLTLYRLHDGNLFQFRNGTAENTRKKQQVLASLAQALRDKLHELGVPPEIARVVVECVQVEADLLRLVLDGGPPWKTLAVERKILEVFHNDASLWQHLFSYARLIPALMLPAATYYRWRYRLSEVAFYKEFRRKFFPFPVPHHVVREEQHAAAGPSKDRQRRRIPT